MKKILLIILAILLTSILLPGASNAQQYTIDFALSGSTGDTGSSFYTDPATGLTVAGYYWDAGSWEPANLYLRNQTNDHGFGVCNPDEVCLPYQGDINELDNAGQNELIVLQLPPGFKWVSVQISSLDTNNDGPVPERGRLYASIDGFLRNPGGAGTDIATFSGGIQPREYSIDIGPTYDRSPFLVLEPYDWTVGGSRNNDFLVWKVTLEGLVDGRMTGGGSVFTEEDVRVTRGFEIHCNLAAPNSLEVNWEGNRFHLLSLTRAICTDDPAIDQKPPKAPLDTFRGEGTGRLNGVDGATIHFVFVDAGEPGTEDTASIVITDKDGNEVLNVSGYMHNGNLQAHFNNK